MKNILHAGVLVALSLVSLPAAHAAYNPAVVAADARWVVYADLNSLRESTLGKELVTALSQAQSQATGGVIGLDVPKLLMTLGSLTAYGSNLTGDPQALDGALIAEGTADLRKIVESLLLQGTIAHPEAIAEVTDLPFPAYSVGDPKAPAGQQTKLVVAFPPEPIVLVGKSKAQLVKAWEVFRGKSPSLAKAGNNAFAKLSNLSDGAYLFAATVVPGDPIFPEKSPQTRLLQLTNSGAVAVGEHGDDAFARVELLATSETNAKKLTTILEGLTAMLSMAETSNNQLAEFLKSAVVTQDKDRVALRLAYPTARLLQMSVALRSQIEAKPRVAAPQPITIGKSLAEWGGRDASAAPSTVDSAGVALQTVENVALVNGSLITVGRATNGAKTAKIDRVEIMAADGTGTPLVWRQEFMRGVGGRNNMWQFAFPGSAGMYTLRVGYINDPVDSPARFAVSLSEPNAPKPSPAPSKGPLIPQPKFIK